MKRSRLAPMSKKRRSDLAKRAVVVAYVHDRDGRCVAAHLVPHVDCVNTRDAHEIIPRSAWPAGWLEPSNIISCCRAHHAWIGDNPAEAHLLGLHGFSWERAS